MLSLEAVGHGQTNDSEFLNSQQRGFMWAAGKIAAVCGKRLECLFTQLLAGSVRAKTTCMDTDTSDSAPLAGMTAVVTGSSSGIGRAIALKLAGAGADCLVHARQNAEGAEEVAEQIRALGRKCEARLVDLADVGGRKQLVEDAWQWNGSVDIWVNNAGVDVLTTEAVKLDFNDKLEKLWHVDVAAAVDLSRQIGELMKRRGRGCILNIGWDQAALGMAGDSGEMFAVTKGAVMAFSKSLAQSLAPEVRVNCLAPGWIKTKWGQQASKYWQQRAERESLMNRWGSPEDVAVAALYLASPGAGYVTGQVLAVNGGFRTGQPQ